MTRRDVRDPVVVYSSRSGWVNIGFTVVPTNTVCLGTGHYVLIPVLNEQAGDAMIADLKRKASDKAMDQPHHGHESADQP